MKFWIGLALFILGIIIGLYVGIWIMFIGGIMLIANGVQTGTLTAVILAWGIIRIIFASITGWVCFFVFGTPGMALMQDK